MQIKISEIKNNPANPRTIRDKQFNDLKRSIAQFPAMLAKRPIAVTRDGKNWMAIGGNQRTRALLDLQKEIEDYDGFLRRYECTPDAAAILTKYFTDGVPVVDCTDLSPDEQRRFIIADNLPFGEWDTEALANEWDVDELKEWGMPEFIFGDPGEGDAAGGSVEADDFEIPDENTIVTDIKLGDLFEIGPHRLLCGDSASIESIEVLMNGKKADIVFTDPPYGVSYVGKTKDALTIENDNLAPKELSSLVKKWFDGVEFAAREGAYLLATVPPGPLHLIFAQDWLDRGWLRQIMVWNKSSMVLGHSEYHYKHEPILFGWKPGPRHKNQDRTKTTVWDFEKPNANRDHPTMKPVKMWVYGICNHTNKSDIVYEPFSGSGTAFVASHEANRVCYGMELDPKYCQVIINRMLKLDPSLEVKKNGEPYIENPVNIS